MQHTFITPVSPVVKYGKKIEKIEENILSKKKKKMPAKKKEKKFA